MSWIYETIRYLSNFDSHIADLIENIGPYAYLVLFMMIFMETGGVITAFLPGDSLLVGAGAFAARGDLSLPILIAGFICATILGDLLNFHIGRYFGGRYDAATFHRFIRHDDWERAKNFYKHKGRRSFLISRFVPVARGLNPFVAGFTRVEYREIAAYNIIGNIIWATFYSFVGFLFGNMEAVQDKFHLLIFLIMGISLVPATVFLVRRRMEGLWKNKA
jgi:membrane-associated protein